jgi:hypothetical protein
MPLGKNPSDPRPPLSLLPSGTAPSPLAEPLPLPLQPAPPHTPPPPTPAAPIATSTDRLERSVHQILTGTDALLHTLETFHRAAERFTGHNRQETLSALLLVVLVAAASATLATLLTLAVLAPRLGLLGILRALLHLV